MKYQLFLQIFYSVNFVYILDVLPLSKINFDMIASDWLRINNKRNFRFANRFAQSEIFKFFIATDK